MRTSLGQTVRPPRTVISLIVALAVLSPAPARGDTTQEQTARIDAYLARWHQTDGLDGVVLVAQGERVIYQKGFGLADRRWGIANGPDTRFDIGSISKQFTTAIVFQLVAEGRVRLDARLTEYLADYRRDTGDRVTIDQLLRHTSGIPCFLRDYVPPAGGPDRFPLERPYERRRLIAEHMSGDLLFEPGSRFQYSNTNYCLLAAVIEKVTGRSFEENLRTLILTPLGLKDTGLLSPFRVNEHLAVGYVRTPLGHRPAAYQDPRTLWGAGGMYSTVGDLLRWNLAIHSDRWLPAATRDRWLTPYEPAGGPVRHAYSLDYFTMRLPKAGRAVGFTAFNGAIEGYITDVVRFPDTGHIVVVLDNSDSFNQQPIATGIYRILLDEPYTLPRRPAAPIVARLVIEQGESAAIKRLQEFRASASEYDLDDLDADLRSLGRSLTAKDEAEAAVAVLALNVRLHPGSAGAHACLAAAYRAAGKVALADEHARKGREIDALESAIVSLVQTGQFDKAKAAIADARRGRPEGTLVPPSRIGPVFEEYLGSNQLDRALALTEVWTLISPTEVGPHFSMARVFIQKGEPDRAINCYRRVLELRPEGPGAEAARREIARLQKLPASPPRAASW